MKRTIRENIIGLPYSLYDMHVTELIADQNNLLIKFAEGFEINTVDGEQVKGEICFHEVDWDFCYVYLFDYCGNEGNFTGYKYAFSDFIEKNKKVDFEIVDETYGYNSSKFAGWVWKENKPCECVYEIYHLGAMEYITEERMG